MWVRVPPELPIIGVQMKRINEFEFQDIPLRTETAKKIRDSFLPKPGDIKIDIDYSSIEMRLAALIKDIDKI